MLVGLSGVSTHARDKATDVLNRRLVGKPYIFGRVHGSFRQAHVRRPARNACPSHDEATTPFGALGPLLSGECHLDRPPSILFYCC
jgi:hypothetical protein